VLTIDAARLALTGYLLKDAEAHEAQRFDEIGRRFDGFEHAFPSGQDKALVDLKVALTFWDAWIDARNHGWQPTAGIQPREWPVLARSIAADIGAARPIADPRVRRLFDTAAHGGLTERAQGVTSRLRERGER
jgi:hypothetical protein